MNKFKYFYLWCFKNLNLCLIIPGEFSFFSLSSEDVSSSDDISTPKNNVYYSSNLFDLWMVNGFHVIDYTLQYNFWRTFCSGSKSARLRNTAFRLVLGIGKTRAIFVGIRFNFFGGFQVTFSLVERRTFLVPGFDLRDFFFHAFGYFTLEKNKKIKKNYSLLRCHLRPT